MNNLNPRPTDCGENEYFLKTYEIDSLADSIGDQCQEIARPKISFVTFNKPASPKKIDLIFDNGCDVDVGVAPVPPVRKRRSQLRRRSFIGDYRVSGSSVTDVSEFDVFRKNRYLSDANEATDFVIVSEPSVHWLPGSTDCSSNSFASDDDSYGSTVVYSSSSGCGCSLSQDSFTPSSGSETPGDAELRGPNASCGSDADLSSFSSSPSVSSPIRLYCGMLANKATECDTDAKVTVPAECASHSPDDGCESPDANGFEYDDRLYREADYRNVFTVPRRRRRRRSKCVTEVWRNRRSYPLRSESMAAEVRMRPLAATKKEPTPEEGSVMDDLLELRWAAENGILLTSAERWLHDIYFSAYHRTEDEKYAECGKKVFDFNKIFKILNKI